MPRIEDRLLKSIIYLYSTKEAAESGSPGGSGFLVGEPCAIPEAVFLFAVILPVRSAGFPRTVPH